MKFKIALGTVLVFCLTSAWAERPGNFRVIGPGGGGAMFNPTISPHDPNTVLVSCDMTGSYITHDGGRTWRMFNLRGVVNFFGGCASGTKVELDTNRLHYSEVTLKATFHHTPETVRKAFALIAEKKIRSTDYITGEAPLSRLQQVLRHMLNRNGDIKTAIIPGH